MTQEKLTTWVSLLRPLGLVALAAALPLVGVSALVVYAEELRTIFETSSPTSIGLGLVVIGAVLSGLALLPTHAVSLSAGWLFGATLGSILAITTVSLGAIIGFIVFQLLSGQAAERFIKENEKTERLYQAVISTPTVGMIFLISLIRLSPLVPFAATNATFSVAKIPFRQFLIGSAIGLAPRVILVAILGAGLAQLTWETPDSPLLTYLGIAATVIMLVGVTFFGKSALKKTLASEAV